MTHDGEGGFGALSAGAGMTAAGTLLLGWGRAGFAVLGEGVTGRDRRVLGSLAGAGASAKAGQFGVAFGQEGLKLGDLGGLGSEERFECLEACDLGGLGGDEGFQVGDPSQ
jgi:hypothetical protein